MAAAEGESLFRKRTIAFAKQRGGEIEMKIFLIIYLLSWLASSIQCYSALESTVEVQNVNGVARAMDIHKELYGRVPTTWEELSKGFDVDSTNRILLKVYGYRLQDRYQFVRKPYPIYKHGGDFDIDEDSKVLLVRVIPYKEPSSGDRVLRTFIYQAGEGYISSFELSEEKAQKLFQTYGITMAAPPGLPAIETPFDRLNRGPTPIPSDPADAKRVWPPGPRGSQASNSSKMNPSTAIGSVTGDSNTSGSRFYLLSGLATASLCAGVWLFLRFIKGRRKG